MKKSIAMVSLVLAILTILPAALVSCGENDSGGSGKPNDDAAGENQNAQDDQENAETEKITYDVPEMDCDGYDFRALCREGWTIYWYCVDVFAEAENGEPVNDAVYKRNRIFGRQVQYKHIRNTARGRCGFRAKTDQVRERRF
ncbi:MAG: hypothetical protein FWG34_04830 [Oscillospiraceae bacterium]|nr:hypothetical protein [Oscillospiraceae bacterium]